MLKPVLITGATGCVGRAVAAACRDAQIRVRGLARKASPPIAMDEFVTGSVEDPDVVRAAAQGVAAIVHLASWVHRIPRSVDDHDVLRRSIVGGTRVVAEAARAEGARLLLASTVAVYGAHEGEADESTAPVPETPYARAKLEAERVAREIPRCTVMRFALVFGPHDRGNFVALVRAVDRGWALQVGAGENRKSVVFVENLADRIVRLLRCADDHPALGQIWNAADDPAPSQAAILRAVARNLGRRAPARVPRVVATAAARAGDIMAAAFGRRPRLEERVDKLARATVFPGRALDDCLGYRPQVSFDEGVRRTVAWYRLTVGS
jgi:nucleoside-diphosphate-sugar epimerase